MLENVEMTLKLRKAEINEQKMRERLSDSSTQTVVASARRTMAAMTAQPTWFPVNHQLLTSEPV